MRLFKKGEEFNELKAWCVEQLDNLKEKVGGPRYAECSLHQILSGYPRKPYALQQQIYDLENEIYRLHQYLNVKKETTPAKPEVVKLVKCK